MIGFDEEHETQITASIFDSFLFDYVLSSQEINNIMTNGKPYVPTDKLIAEEFVRTGPYGKNQSPNDKHNITIKHSSKLSVNNDNELLLIGKESSNDVIHVIDTLPIKLLKTIKIIIMMIYNFPIIVLLIVQLMTKTTFIHFIMTK